VGAGVFAPFNEKRFSEIMISLRLKSAYAAIHFGEKRFFCVSWRMRDCMEVRKNHYEKPVYSMQEYADAWSVARELRIEHKDLAPNEGIEMLRLERRAAQN
jgi:hypothetical protein